MKDSKALLNKANKLIADFTAKKTALLNDIEKATARAEAADKRAAEAVLVDNASEFSTAKREAELARDLVEFKKAQLQALITEADRIEVFRKFADEAKACRNDVHAEMLKKLVVIQDDLKACLEDCDQEEKAITEIISNLGEVLGISDDDMREYTNYTPLNLRIYLKNYLVNVERVTQALKDKNPNFI